MRVKVRESQIETRAWYSAELVGGMLWGAAKRGDVYQVWMGLAEEAR